MSTLNHPGNTPPEKNQKPIRLSKKEQKILISMGSQPMTAKQIQNSVNRRFFSDPSSKGMGIGAVFFQLQSLEFKDLIKSEWERPNPLEKDKEGKSNYKTYWKTGEGRKAEAQAHNEEVKRLSDTPLNPRGLGEFSCTFFDDLSRFVLPKR